MVSTLSRGQSHSQHGERARLLDACRSFSKRATIGGEQDSRFEGAFAQLAFTYIKDKAPRLLDHVVGFQLVDRNNDNTKAVGVFGFQVGNRWLYAPVFFLNGELKGHELLYIKGQDMFVPLKESWINYVISRRPDQMGQPVTGTEHDLGVQMPDLRPLTIPPHIAKRGSATPRVYPEQAAVGWTQASQGFRGVYSALTTGDLATAAARSLAKHAGTPTAGELLRSALRESVTLCKLAMDAADHDPLIAQGLDRWHRGVITEALSGLRNRLEKSAAGRGLDEGLSSIVMRHHFGGGAKARRRPKSRRSILEPEEDEVKEASGPSVSIDVPKDRVFGRRVLPPTDEEQAWVARNGYLVRDERAGDEVSIVYNTQVKAELTNPDTTGLFELLVAPGDFRRCLVLESPIGMDRADGMVAIEADGDGGRHWINAQRTTLWTKPSAETRADFEKWFDGLSSPSLSDGDVCVVLSPSGKGSCPLEIDRVLGDGRYEVHSLGHIAHWRPELFPAASSHGPPCMTSNYCDGLRMLHLDAHEGHKPRLDLGVLYAPKGSKVIKLKDYKHGRPGDLSSTDDASQSEDSRFEPGDLSLLQLQIETKTAALKVATDGIEGWINDGPRQTNRDCLFDLILSHGLRHDDARDVMRLAEKAAAAGKAARLRILYGPAYPRVKSAYGLNPGDEWLGPGPGAPGYPEPAIGRDVQYGNVPAMYQDEHFLPVPGLDPGRTDPSIYNVMPEAMPDPMLMQSASRASRIGQKEVFDTSMLTGLLKTVRQDSMFSRHLGDLLKALDRLGRLIFLFYWHNDEFSDRYGQSDMPELEDSLRNSFEGLGDLVLFLKEKDVNPLLRGDAGEPSIEEAARN